MECSVHVVSSFAFIQTCTGVAKPPQAAKTTPPLAKSLRRRYSGSGSRHLTRVQGKNSSQATTYTYHTSCHQALYITIHVSGHACDRSMLTISFARIGVWKDLE